VADNALERLPDAMESRTFSFWTQNNKKNIKLVKFQTAYENIRTIRVPPQKVGGAKFYYGEVLEAQLWRIILFKGLAPGYCPLQQVSEHLSTFLSFIFCEIYKFCFSADGNYEVCKLLFLFFHCLDIHFLQQFFFQSILLQRGGGAHGRHALGPSGHLQKWAFIVKFGEMKSVKTRIF
jgi:hypothetical protein